jgi:polysaccharide export outer membrane protein
MRQVLILLAAGTLWGQQPAEAPPPPPAPRPERVEEAPRPATTGARDVVIGPEDVVTIYALDAEELSRGWRVSSTGELNLPLVGKVQAGGLSVEEFERQLVEKLKTVIRFPQVFVSVTEIRSQPVTVMGAVAKPGALQIAGRRTLLQVLMEAGGPADPGPTLTVTRRKEYGALPLAGARASDDGHYTVAELNVPEVLEGRSEAANLVMRPYDLVTVSPKPKVQRLVHVIGEVSRPGAIELVQQQSVTLMQALAVVGGTTRLASPSKSMIMHVNPDGLRTEIAMVDLKKVAQGKVKDLELVAGDIVVVPSSQWRSYLDLSSRSFASGSWYVLARF